jgi:hypothetical protein
VRGGRSSAGLLTEAVDAGGALGQECEDLAFDGVVEVGGHVPVAFGGDLPDGLGLQSLGAAVHGVAGDVQRAVRSIVIGRRLLTWAEVVDGTSI